MHPPTAPFLREMRQRYLRNGNNGSFCVAMLSRKFTLAIFLLLLWRARIALSVAREDFDFMRPFESCSPGVAPLFYMISVDVKVS